MTDDSFIACICASPADDGPRLVYADFLEEQGRADRAELIRVQIALSHIEPRRKFENCTGFYSRRDRIELLTVQPVDGIRPREGERIDVTLNRRDAPPGVKLEFFGLLVTDVITLRVPLEGMTRTEIGLKIDEESVPWTGESLRTRSSAILTANPEWAYDLARIFIPTKESCRPRYEYGHSGCYNPDGHGVIRWEWRRGFVERLSISWESWHPHAAAVLARNPITRVELTTWPEMQSNEHLRMWRFRGPSAIDGPFLSWHAIPGVPAGGHWQDAIGPLLAAEWPGIEFAMPPDDWLLPLSQPDRVRLMQGRWANPEE